MRLGEFRFFCQKVLPLVYDTELSYYEVLCKVVDYLNKTMETVNDLSDEFENLRNSFNELKDYVDTEIAKLRKYIDDELAKYNDEYFDNLIEQKFLEMIDSGYFPVYKFINYLPEYNMSELEDNGIRVIKRMNSSYNWYGCCEINGYLYIISNDRNDMCRIHKIDLSNGNIVKTVEIGTGVFIKTMSYDSVNNRIMGVDAENKYLYYFNTNLNITGVLKYNRTTNKYSNIITFDLMGSAYGVTIPKGSNDILIYSYNGTGKYCKLIGYKTIDCIGNLEITDCSTNNNLLFILCSLETSSTKYSNTCIIAYSPSQGIFKKIILPKIAKRFNGISAYYLDGNFRGFYLNTLDGEIYRFICSDNILKKSTPTTMSINDGYEEIFSFSNDEYGYVEDTYTTEIDSVDRELRFPLSFYTPMSDSDSLNLSYDRIKIGTGVIGSEIGDVYMFTNIGTPSVIFSIKSIKYSLKIRYEIGSNGLATFTHYDFRDYDNDLTLSGNLQHFKSNCADYLIPYIDVYRTVDNVRIYTIGMFSNKVRYKSNCLYQTLQYKGTPYNTIGCIPLDYPYDDRNVSITVTANPANLGTTFNISENPQSVGVTTMSGATTYEVINQVLSDGVNTYDNLLSYSVSGNTVSVSATINTGGVYTGGITVRGTTGLVYDDIFIPITINAIAPTPPSIFSSFPSTLNLKSLYSSTNYFTSSANVNLDGTNTLRVVETATHGYGSTSRYNYLAVPASGSQFDLVACVEFTPEFLQGKENITVITATENTGACAFIIRGDDLTIPNTKRSGGKYYGTNSNWSPLGSVMPLDSNNKYYIAIAKTGTTGSYLADTYITFG